MSNIELSHLEDALKKDPNNQSLLTLILNQYLKNRDAVSLLHLVDFYRGTLHCKAEIKQQLAAACSELKLTEEADIFLENTTRKNQVDTIVPIRKNYDKSLLHVVENISSINFQSVGGLAEVKKQVTRRIIAPFKNPNVFQRFRRKAGGGILLYGPPGCGKTLLARATAGECGCAFYNIMLTDILSKWIGESEQNLHEIFEKARQHKPAVIFFDEIETIAGKRQYHESNNARSSLISLLLTELDGFNQSNSGVLVLAATNVPWAIDSAFRRPGRFDKQFFVPPPDKLARSTILKKLLQDKPHDTNIDIESIVKLTVGFSGADLNALIEAAEDVIIDEMLVDDSQKASLLKNKQLIDASKTVKPSTLEWLATARNFVEYAEVGGQYDDLQVFLKNNVKL